jgi:hypothetical protein
LVCAGSENVSIYLEVADGSDTHVDGSPLAQLFMRSQSSPRESKPWIATDDSQRGRNYHEISNRAFTNDCLRKIYLFFWIFYQLLPIDGVYRQISMLDIEGDGI